MRIVKDASIRKSEILDAAFAIFKEKGYDNTTISELIEAVGVARGTVYYHFKSKEDILDALVERMRSRALSEAMEIAEDKGIPVIERLLKALIPLTGQRSEDSKLIEHIHKPQNALMRQKTHSILLGGIPPIISKIVEDGIKEKLFDTPCPFEAVEMIIGHSITVFDDEHMMSLSPEEQKNRINAFIINIERLLGAKPGSLTPLLQIFEKELK